MDSVECLSNHEYADRPIALTWNGQRIEIASILAQWRGPGEKGFCVQTVDGNVFEVTYREIPESWKIRPISPTEA